MTKFWCNGKEGFCPHDYDVRNCVCCKYKDGTGGVHIPDAALANADEICAMRDQVHNLTLYLTEALALCPEDLKVLEDWHPGLPGYAPENGGRIHA